MGLLFGVIIDTLDPKEEPGLVRLSALRFDDHLLRRFGLAELIELEPQYEAQLSLRVETDEVWVLLEGQIHIRMIDLRQSSPTLNETWEAELNAPMRVLVPFGVAAGWRAVDHPATLLRLTTHDDDEAPKQMLDWDSE